MPGRWENVPIGEKLFTNVGETVLRKSNAAVENAFYNEASGITRFPGMVQFAELAANSPTYLHEWEGDLIAVSNSRIYKITKDGTATDVTVIPLSGNFRPIFDRTTNELVIAAGAEILRFDGKTTELLSDNAPRSTHVQFIDDFLLAVEVDTGVFFHCAAGDFRSWDPIDVFAANSKPDQLNGMIVTPYREVILTGVDSIEQFNRLNSGTSPFYRRWSVGEGIKAPYTLAAFDQGVWGIDKKSTLNRFTGQISDPRSDDIGRTLEGVKNWTDAWGAEVNLLGQKFYLLQIPNSENIYGNNGITALYDIRQKKWFSLYGWDTKEFTPARWPGWSYYKMWERHFVGGNGKVLELKDGVYRNDGVKQRALGRTAHIDSWGECSVDNVRIRVKRGIGLSDDPDAEQPTMYLTCVKDNKYRTRKIPKSLGGPGDTTMTLEFGRMGMANTWQFEWEIDADCEFEIVNMQALVQSVGEK